MSESLYELPLPDEYLILLGRQARAAGAIELVTRWLTRALLSPQDVNASAHRVRTLQYSQVTQVAGFWDRRQRRTDVDLPTMSAAAEEAERVEAGGVSVLRQSLEMLGCPKAKPPER